MSYFSTYHDFYIENFDKYRDRLSIVPREIHACKLLTSQLLRSIEGKSARLNMPTEEGLESVVRLINHVDEFILLYSENKTTLFDILNDFLSDPRSNPYRVHCFGTLLQNYVCYILFFKFDEINDLVDYFKDTPLWCKIIVNKIFADTIFIQKILRQNRIDLTEYKNVVEFFDEEARRIHV